MIANKYSWHNNRIKFWYKFFIIKKMKNRIVSNVILCRSVYKIIKSYKNIK